ncbi:MAG: hypothetical protein K5869_05960 [Saccharofermentans sp.]|nr:hypothetical protein [Saccharofermentans sp.]
MKKTIRPFAFVLTAVMTLGMLVACAYKPKTKTETEKVNVNDGMLPQVIEREASYVQKTKDGEWELEKAEILKWELSQSEIPDSVRIISTDDAKSVYPALDDSFKGRKAAFYFRFNDDISGIQATVNKGADGSSTMDVKMQGTADVVFSSGGNKMKFDGIKVLGALIDADGSTDLKVDIGQGEAVLKAPAKVKNAGLKDFMAAQSDTFISNESFKDLTRFDVTSSLVKRGAWDKKISTDGGNTSPDLKWDKIDGASRYVVIMIDGNWLHMDVFTTDTSLAEGAYKRRGGEGAEFVGPYPPRGSTHTYSVFVFALKNEPGKNVLFFDCGGNNINEIFKGLDTDSSGSQGNVIAYGRLDGNYTSK